MKKPLLPVLILLLCAIFVSCKKESTKTQPKDTNILPTSSLIGSNWTVVNDLQVAGNIHGGNLPSTTSNYIGKTSDYFSFHTNGKLYFSINSQLDTAGTTYKISGDTVMCITYFSEGTSAVLNSDFYAAYIISNLTNKTCTLYNYTVGLDAPVATTINLSR